MTGRAVRLLSLAAFAGAAALRASDPLLPLLAAEFGTTRGGASTTMQPSSPTQPAAMDAGPYLTCKRFMYSTNARIRLRATASGSYGPGTSA